MNMLGLFPPLQTLGVELVLAPVLLVLLSGGLVGMSIRNMFDSILSDDGDAVDPNDAANPTGGGDDGMTDDGMTDGGLMAEDGDDFGEFGGLDDGDDDFDDDFGDMDDAGAGNDELEHRLDELENEVGSLSSTVNTVRTENEQISESVESVEENVRKLLDIYEMVTRGVNPFADDIEAGMGDAGEGSSFGLFDDGGGGGGGDDAALDDDIATADAEGFFDEDLVDDEDDEFDVDSGEFEEDDVFDAAEDEADDEFDEDFDEEFDDDFASEDDGGEGGKSFQELKDEYDAGDAEWAEGEAPAGEGTAPEGEGAASEDEGAPAGGDPAEAAIDQAGSAADDADLADDELFDEVIEDDGPEDADAGETASATETADAATDATSRAADAGKPYLATLPGGFAGDLLVVEWLEFLTERSSYRAVDDAIDYYERIDWISPAVADELRGYLRGFDAVEGDGGSLTIDDHTQSLQYISQLDGDGAGATVLSKLGGGGGNGLQR